MQRMTKVYTEARKILSREPELPAVLEDGQTVDQHGLESLEGVSIPEIAVAIEDDQVFICDKPRMQSSKADQRIRAGLDEPIINKNREVELRIDPGFAWFIPTMTGARFRKMETAIVEGQFNPALVVWLETGIMVGGLYATALCHQLGLGHDVVGVSRPDRRTAQIWTVRSQLRRADLSRSQRIGLGLHLLALLETEDLAPTEEDLLLDSVATEAGVPKRTLRTELEHGRDTVRKACACWPF